MQSQRLRLLNVNWKAWDSLENSEREQGDESGLVFLLLCLAQVDCMRGKGVQGTVTTVTQA